MPNWISITLDTLHEAKVAALVDACDSAALADGQANRSTGIIQGVVDHVRRKVASCRRNQLDSDLTTIPKGLRDITVDLIIARLKNTLEIELTKDEADNVVRRERDLNRVASCEDVVDKPDDAVVADMEPTVPDPAFGNFKFRRRDRQDG